MEQFGAVLDLEWIACVESIMDGRFWCLNDARNVLQSGGIKVKLGRQGIRNKRETLSKLTLSYLILSYPYPILPYLQLQGGVLIIFQHLLSNL